MHGMRRLKTFSGLAFFMALSGPLLGAEEGASGGDFLRVLTGLEPESIAVPLRVFAIVTVLGVVPSIVLLATCFPRILIVLSFLRRALGTQDLPSNQIIAGLTLILTILIMLPVWKKIHAEALVPLQTGEVKSTEVAIERAGSALKRFMLAHTLEKDLQLFVDLAETQQEGEAGPGESPNAEGETMQPLGTLGTLAEEERTLDDLGFFVVLPAFVLSELKVAFQMGFLLYLPFLAIDLAVSAVLISMGMFMLPPVLVSLPLKVLVFVLADGWNLVVGQIIESFRVMA